MYKLNVEDMSPNKVRQALGIFQEEYAEDEFPLPVPLRRSYKANCPLCAGRSSTMIGHRRIATCWPCKVMIGKQALHMKIAVLRRRRTLKALIVSQVSRSYLRNMPYLQRKIVNYII